MGQIKTFRDMIAWQKGIQLAKEVYKVTQTFPEIERFGLVIQLRRAAVSIPSNIAEGYARASLPDYLRFLKVARGSLAELETQLHLASELGFMKAPTPLIELIAETDRVLQCLSRSLQKPKE